MEIDIIEYEKQRKKRVLESGKYARLEIIVPKDEEQPIVSIEAKGVSTKEIALLLASTKTSVEVLVKEYPLAGLIAANMKPNGKVVDAKTGEMGEL